MKIKNYLKYVDFLEFNKQIKNFNRTKSKYYSTNRTFANLEFDINDVVNNEILFLKLIKKVEDSFRAIYSKYGVKIETFEIQYCLNPRTHHVHQHMFFSCDKEIEKFKIIQEQPWISKHSQVFTGYVLNEILEHNFDEHEIRIYKKIVIKSEIVFDDFCDEIYENLKENLKEELKEGLNYNVEESYYYYVGQDKKFGDYYIKYGFFEKRPHIDALPVKKETANLFCHKYLKKYGDVKTFKTTRESYYKYLGMLSLDKF